LGFVRWDQSYIDDTGAETLLEIAIWDLNAVRKSTRNRANQPE
jgi:hypothetical protein